MTPPTPSHSDYTPFLLGQRFVVLPPGAPASAAEERIALRMVRGAFGSGAHETTGSCVELLESLAPLDGARVLDLGSGTGILAIAALMLGASRAVLIDNDPAAIESSRLHCQMNGVAERTQLLHGELRDLQDRDFDLVLANLQGDILLAVAEDLVRVASPGARLVLSGIAWEYNWNVRDAYTRLGCTERSNRFLSEYSSALLVRGPRA